jgi:Tfp pilus assembly protein PilF
MRLKKRSRSITKVLLVVVLNVSLYGCASAGKKTLTSEDRVKLYVDMGNSSLVDGDPTGALESFKQAEAIDDSVPELNHSLALTFYLKRDLKTALHYAQRAVQKKSNYTNANTTLGKIYLELGMLDQASEPLNQAAHDPLNREAYKAWTSLGILEERKGNLDSADAMYSQAIQSDGSNSCLAYFYRGNLRLQKKQTSEAIRDYTLASQKFCAKFGDAFLALGQAYQQSRQYDLARKTYLEVVQRYPDSPLANKAIEQLRFLP